MDLSSTAKIMILSVALVCAAMLAAGLVIIIVLTRFEVLDASAGIAQTLGLTGTAYMLGLALGGAHSALKVIMLEKSLNKIADAQQEKQAKNMGQLAFIGRYIITGAVLVAAALVPFFGLFGAIMGIVSLRFAAYITVAIENRLEKK